MVEEGGLIEDRAQHSDKGQDEDRDLAGQRESNGVKESAWRQAYVMKESWPGKGPRLGWSSYVSEAVQVYIQVWAGGRLLGCHPYLPVQGPQASVGGWRGLFQKEILAG